MQLVVCSDWWIQYFYPPETGQKYLYLKTLYTILLLAAYLGWLIFHRLRWNSSVMKTKIKDSPLLMILCSRWDTNGKCSSRYGGNYLNGLSYKELVARSTALILMLSQAVVSRKKTLPLKLSQSEGAAIPIGQLCAKTFANYQWIYFVGYSHQDFMVNFWWFCKHLLTSDNQYFPRYISSSCQSCSQPEIHALQSHPDCRD